MIIDQVLYRQNGSYCITGYIHKVISCRASGMGKGVGEGGGGHVPPHFQKWGTQVGLCLPPLLGIANVANYTICSYFVVKNTIFF